MSIIELVKEYYDKRGLKWPTFDEAMKFVHTEIAEVYELDLARIGGFIRNHPENKPKFSKESLAEELGDAIFMLIVAGIAEGVNPLDAMTDKMLTKLKRLEKERKNLDDLGFPQKISPSTSTINFKDIDAKVIYDPATDDYSLLTDREER